MPVLAVLFVAVVVVVLLAIAAQPAASPARINGYVARYRLSLGDAGRAYIADHLLRTRRYRLAGVIGSFVVIAIVSAPTGYVRWDLDTIAAGWLLGAAAAESALARRNTGPRDERLVPRWLIAVPHVVGGACLVAGMVLHHIEPGHVVRWTCLALLVLGVTVRAVIVAEDRGSPDDADARSADRAVRANSVATITAVGTAVAIAFEFRAAASVRPADANDGGLGFIWLIGVIGILLMITRVARWSMHPGGRRLHRPEVQLLAATTALAVATAGYFGWHWWHNHPPYPASAVHPVGVIKLTDQAHAKDDLTALGTTDLNPLTALPGEQLILGRVDFAEPAVSSRGGYYYFILIDKRTNTGVFELYDGRGSGWGSNLDLVAERYPWLSALAPQPVGQGWRTTGASALQVATKQTSETFVALIPEEAGISADDLLLTMVFMGSDGQIYWATQVPLTTV